MTRASNLIYVLAAVLAGVFAITSELRPAAADDFDVQCQYCLMEGESCLMDSPRVFRGCCSGNACSYPNGKVSGCCGGSNPICDATTGNCVATCPYGTTRSGGGCCKAGWTYQPKQTGSGQCQFSGTCPVGMDLCGSTCVYKCPPGTVRNTECNCKALCKSHQDCGAACCPAGQECSIPASSPPGQPIQTQAKCCRRGHACGTKCDYELAAGEKCCAHGLYGVWAAKGQVCCATGACAAPGTIKNR
jgi:hypothetical protein